MIKINIIMNKYKNKCILSRLLKAFKTPDLQTPNF